MPYRKLPLSKATEPLGVRSVYKGVGRKDILVNSQIRDSQQKASLNERFESRFSNGSKKVDEEGRSYSFVGEIGPGAVQPPRRCLGGW